MTQWLRNLIYGASCPPHAWKEWEGGLVCISCTLKSERVISYAGVQGKR